jgi:uncharacterized membrane protein
MRDTPSPAMPAGVAQANEPEARQISQNIEAVVDFYKREDLKISRWQRWLEALSMTMGKPWFMAGICLFVLVWALTNVALDATGKDAFDPAPFLWLQGMVGLGALLTATVVLSKQNRFAKLAEQRAHLDLKVTLLIEQKAAKLIDLVEELRHDLPNVHDRSDAKAQALQQPMTPGLVLAALDEGGSASGTANLAQPVATTASSAPIPPQEPA